LICSRRAWKSFILAHCLLLSRLPRLVGASPSW
jgi:hypothetical protein